MYPHVFKCFVVFELYLLSNNIEVIDNIYLDLAMYKYTKKFYYIESSTTCEAGAIIITIIISLPT